MENQLDEAFFDGIPTDVQLGQFFLLVFQFLNNFPDLPLSATFVLSTDRWNLIAFFDVKSQVILNN